MSEYSREWYERNKQSVLDKQKKYRCENKEAINARRRARYLENREKCISRASLFQKKNPESARASTKKWAAENKDKIAEWRKNNPFKMREYYNRRRLREGAGNGFSKQDIEILLQQQVGRCNYCHSSLIENKMHVDHIIPISRGGEHSSRNIQLLCMSCNCSKGQKMPIDWAFYFCSSRPFLEL